MITFWFNTVATEPARVDQSPFVFKVEMESEQNNTVRITFSLPSKGPYRFVVNGKRQLSFSTTVEQPVGVETHDVEAEVNGPAGRVSVGIRGTNVDDREDSVRFGTAVRV